MQINAYFKSVPDNAVEIRKFSISDWYVRPAILGSLCYYFNRLSNGCCLYLTCDKYGCRQFRPVQSKFFPVSKVLNATPHEDIPCFVPEFKVNVL